MYYLRAGRSASVSPLLSYAFSPKASLVCFRVGLDWVVWVAWGERNST